MTLDTYSHVLPAMQEDAAEVEFDTAVLPNVLVIQVFDSVDDNGVPRSAPVTAIECSLSDLAGSTTRCVPSTTDDSYRISVDAAPKCAWITIYAHWSELVGDGPTEVHRGATWVATVSRHQRCADLGLS